MITDYTIGSSIKNTGTTSYALTGLTFDTLSYFVINLEVPELTNDMFWTPFGGYGDGHDFTGLVYQPQSGLQFFYKGSYITLSDAFKATGHRTFCLDNSTLYDFNGNITTIPASDSLQVTRFGIMAAPSGQGTYTSSTRNTMQVYYAKMYRYADDTHTGQPTLISEMLPAVRNADQQPGFYDTVRDLFIAVPGSEVIFDGFTQYSLTVNPTPADATVTFSTDVEQTLIMGNTIRLSTSGTVSYTVTKNGYEQVSGSVEVTDNTTVPVALKAITTSKTPVINYDFPWYIQNSPVFMTLYTGFAEIAAQVSSLPFIDMLDLNNVNSYSELLTAGQFFGVSNAWYGYADALIYNLRQWGPRTTPPNYYWNGRASTDSFRLMANYIRAKVQIRGQPLSLINLKKFYETALDGYNYSVEDGIEIIESEQHFEIIVTATDEIAQALVEMSYTDDFPFGKPVGISYNITYVLS